MVRAGVRLTLLAAWVSVLPSSALAGTPNPCVTPAVVLRSITAAADLPTTDAIVVASLNMHGQEGIVENLSAWVDLRTVDILLLQEVGRVSADGQAFAGVLAARLGFGFAFAPVIPYDNGHAQGVAIFSRFPIEDASVHPLNHFQLVFRSRCRIALAATVRTPTGPIRLVNVHLDTRINSGSRVAQLGPALDAAGSFNGPRLIGGDFNTMNILWVGSTLPLPYLQRQSGAVRKMMSKHGFSTPFGDTPATFRVLGLPLKLDWLYLLDLKPLNWGVDRIELSDHRGVWTHVQLDIDTVEARPKTCENPGHAVFATAC
jgi:endonuclease/exonuclease/phosphatase family metal-dependent hydrolase